MSFQLMIRYIHSLYLRGCNIKWYLVAYFIFYWLFENRNWEYAIRYPRDYKIRDKDIDPSLISYVVE